METPVQRCFRLLAALEEMVAQEAACLASSDFGGLVGLQQRAEPLVAHLGRYGSTIADEEFRSRVGSWLARRREIAGLLSARISETRERLNQLESSRRRVARVVPVYAHNSQVTRRLSAVG
jgi:hypothetical protein